MTRSIRLIEEAPSQEVAKYNRALEGEFMDAENFLRNQLKARFTKGDGISAKRLKYRPIIDFGELIGAKFRMPRHAILREHGVGRGQKKGEAGPWRAVPWFSDYWDQGGMKRLADVMQDRQSDVLAGAAADQVVKQFNISGIGRR